jgi:hypothetical protein
MKEQNKDDGELDDENIDLEDEVDLEELDLDDFEEIDIDLDEIENTRDDDEELKLEFEIDDDSDASESIDDENNDSEDVPDEVEKKNYLLKIFIFVMFSIILFGLISLLIAIGPLWIIAIVLILIFLSIHR